MSLRNHLVAATKLAVTARLIIPALRARYELRSRVGGSALYFPLRSMLRGRASQVVSKESDIVVEGFPRSGNSFFCCALRVHQTPALRIASHVHLPCHIQKALQLQKPTVLLVRKPADSIASLLARYRYLSAEAALRSYIRFYQACWRFRDKVLVLNFVTATEHTDSAIRQINARFGLRLLTLEQRQLSVQHIKEVLEGSSSRAETAKRLPHPRKEAIKSLFDVQHHPLFSECQQVYQKWQHLSSKPEP